MNIPDLAFVLVAVICFLIGGGMAWVVHRAKTSPRRYKPTKAQRRATQRRIRAAGYRPHQDLGPDYLNV